MILIAEPQRRPTSVGVLRAVKECQTALDGRFHAICVDVSQPISPGGQRPQCVGRQVAAAAIEGQLSPAAAERRPAAIGVLQVEQPTHAGGGCRGGASFLRPASERQQSAGGVVDIGDSAAQIAPAPTAGGSARVGMHVVF